VLVIEDIRADNDTENRPPLARSSAIRPDNGANLGMRVMSLKDYGVEAGNRTGRRRSRHFTSWRDGLREHDRR
jgi:hypothetical protein